VLEHLDELARFQQGVLRPGVEPGRAATEIGQSRVATPHVHVVQVGDLELATWRRQQALGHVHHVGVVEIQPGDRQVRPRPGRLFLHAEQDAGLVHLGDAVAFRIADG
jgi:hypothetical protein